MIAHELAREAAPGNRIEQHQCHAAGTQPRALGLPEAAGAKAIEQHEYPDAAGCGAHKGFDEAIGDAPGGGQVKLGQHVVLARLDGLEHAREEIRRMSDQAEAIAVPFRGALQS